MGQIPFVSEVTRYLDGFLAAARPGNGRVDLAPPSATQPDPVPRPASSAELEAELPATENIKRRLHPLDAFPRLLECVATNHPPDLDDQFRFQWFGLFYQAPRQDAFRLRLRLPGGRLRAYQFAGLAEVTQRWAAGEVLLNAQGGLDIPGVPLPMVAEILRGIESVGLSARLTGGDCVQCVRGGEYDGWGDARAGAVYPLVCSLEQALAHSRRLADLPNGCEVIFPAANEPVPVSRHESLDSLIVRAVASESGGGTSFLLGVPGEPEGGWRVPASQVVQGCLELLESWAIDADRIRQPSAGLADHCHSLRNKKAGALFNQAKWQAVPRPSAVKPAPLETTAPPGLPIPGARLLSGQLRRIAEILRENESSEARLIRGSFHLAPESDARVREAVGIALQAR